jgi:hypothetical protein
VSSKKSRTHLLQRVIENAVRRQARIHIVARRDGIFDMVA